MEQDRYGQSFKMTEYDGKDFKRRDLEKKMKIHMPKIVGGKDGGKDGEIKGREGI